MKIRIILATFTALLLAACGGSRDETGAAGIPSGTYAIDPSHSYVTFSYLHQGLSFPLLRATSAAGELEFDADNIQNSSVNVAIAADSIRSNIDYFDEELASRKFFNADKYPHITFRSDSYEPVGDSDGVLRGQVTIRGVTRPIELGVTLNDAIIHPMLEIPVVGFSATGSLNRSEFGLARGVPVVSDTVRFQIEIEFLQGSNEASQAAVQAVALSTAGT